MTTGAGNQEPVRLTVEQRQSLVSVVNALELGAEIERVRELLPVPYVEQAGYSKEPPRTLIGTSLYVFVELENPGRLNEVRDLWVGLWFDPEGKLTSITSRVAEIESRYVEGSPTEWYINEWLLSRVDEGRQ